MDNKEWFLRALRAIDQLTPGEIFELNEVLGDEWLSEPFGRRTDFGKYFSRAVKNEEVPEVEVCGVGRNNHRVYRRVG